MITQSDFNPDDSELRCLLRRLKGGTSTTKDVLESTFAHLADIAQRQSKNKKMGFYSRWLYTVSAPYSRESCPQFLPNAGDWLRYRLADPSLQKQFASLGNVKQQRMPDIRYGEDSRFPQQPADVKFRNAGPLSHQKSAAALAYMLEDEATNFANVTNAWHCAPPWFAPDLHPS